MRVTGKCHSGSILARRRLIWPQSEAATPCHKLSCTIWRAALGDRVRSHAATLDLRCKVAEVLQQSRCWLVDGCPEALCGQQGLRGCRHSARSWRSSRGSPSPCRRRAQLGLQVPPCQGTLRLSAFRDSAVGRDADLPTDVEGSASVLTSTAWVYWPAGAGASAALMSRRCVEISSWFRGVHGTLRNSGEQSAGHLVGSPKASGLALGDSSATAQA